ncbi:plakophilin-3-like [Lampetra fluviatilis]
MVVVGVVVGVLARVLGTSGDAETLRQASGALWNLSSMESLKEEIVATSLDVLVRRVQGTAGSPNPDAEVFYNVTGCLRNLSSASQAARGRMRESPGLVDSLVKFASNAVEHGTINETAPDSRVRASVENCVCTLRNLTYRLSDEAGPSVAAQLHAQPISSSYSPSSYSPYSPSYSPSSPPSSSPPSYGAAPGDYEEPGCFSSRSRAVKEAVEQQDVEFTQNPRGAQWLWNPQAVRLYAELLKTRGGGGAPPRQPPRGGRGSPAERHRRQLGGTKSPPG